jgi:transcriptional regulator with XRE-family HTH domain
MRVDGEKLRELRNEKLLTMEEMTSLSGVSYNTLYRLEHNLTGARTSSIKKLARVLGVAPQELLLRSTEAKIKT